MKREGDIAKFIQNTSDDAKFGAAMQQAISPFAQVLALDAPNPFTALRNYAQTAAQLRTGSASMKAQVISNLIKQYDVDIETLDKTLAGEDTGSAEESRLASLLDERLKPVQDFMSRAEKARHEFSETQSQAYQSEIQKFAGSEGHEFFEDVRQDMADLIELAQARGRAMTLEEAYQACVRARPDLQEALKTRTEAEQLRERARKVAEKKKAASSLKSTTPKPKGQGDADDLRSTLEQAWDNAEAE